MSHTWIASDAVNGAIERRTEAGVHLGIYTDAHVRGGAESALANFIETPLCGEFGAPFPLA